MAGKRNYDIEPKAKSPGVIRSMNIPREVRDSIKAEARARGISASALTRQIMQEYNSGQLMVPDAPGSQIVGTSVWVPIEMWTKFSKKSDANGHSTQWIFRSWLDREQVQAAG